MLLLALDSGPGELWETSLWASHKIYLAVSFQCMTKFTTKKKKCIHLKKKIYLFGKHKQEQYFQQILKKIYVYTLYESFF